MQSVGSTSFTYDKDGIRASKGTKKGVTSYVYYNGNLYAEIFNDEITYYFYNATGICGARYKGEDYEYVKNAQGDVVAILKGGLLVAKYTYDAWGNHTTTYTSTGMDFAQINPFRYRGYYYDVETGLYYLLTRYYDPTIGQFINPDTPDFLDPTTIDGVNLYAYCLNNPIFISSNNHDYKANNQRKNKTLNLINIINEVNRYEEYIGFSINYGKESITDFYYYWLLEIEEGIGYSKSFNNGKPINFCLNAPEQLWRINDYYASFDMNFNGYGFGIALGGETSITLHLGNNSLDIFANAFGRIGWKWITEDENGSLSYWKFEFNVPEIVVTYIALYYCGYYALSFFELLLSGGLLKT